jgi:hypothetical protein
LIEHRVQCDFDDRFDARYIKGLCKEEKSISDTVLTKEGSYCHKLSSEKPKCDLKLLTKVYKL